jgi:hypothetical protein
VYLAEATEEGQVDEVSPFHHAARRDDARSPECAEMFQSMPESTFLEAGDARLYRSFVSTRKILYDASDPEDGQRYRDNRPSKLMSPAE